MSELKELLELTGLPELFTPDEVARWLKVHPETVLSWIRAGKMFAYNLHAGTQEKPWYRIPREEIEQKLRG